MALSLADISQKAVIRAPRMVILGTDKVGKSAFATGSRYEGDVRVQEGINKPIVLPFQGEEGIDDFSVPKFDVIRTWGDALSALEWLYVNDHPHRTVVCDSMTTLEQLTWKHLCLVNKVNSIEKVGGGFGKGYIEAAGLFRSFCDGLDALREKKGMASVLIGHVKVKRFDDPNGSSYDQYQFDIHDRAASALYRWADFTGFATTKTVVQTAEVGFNKEIARAIDPTDGQRYLYTKKRPAHPGGGRGIYGELPFEIPLDWASFEAAVVQAMKNRQENAAQKGAKEGTNSVQ